MNKRKVYIPYLGPHNQDKMAAFGEVVIITNKSLNPTGLEGITAIVQDVFDNVPPAKGDLLAVCGHQILILIASLELLEIFNEVNFLIFDAKQQEYVERKLSLVKTKGAR